MYAHVHTSVPLNCENFPAESVHAFARSPASVVEFVLEYARQSIAHQLMLRLCLRRSPRSLWRTRLESVRKLSCHMLHSSHSAGTGDLPSLCLLAPVVCPTTKY